MAKRIFDVVVSLILLVCLAVPLILIAAVIAFKLGRPVLFSQLRPGKNGKPFLMIKFRTMTNDCDEKGVLLSDEDRLTQLGMKLRALSIDELPELWNVLKGDMSLVGPRPMLMEYLELYTSEQSQRHNVRPGITGLAQINGRNNTSWEDRFSYDVMYVKRQSFLLDLRILAITVKKVLTKEGVSPDGELIMPQFTGTNSEQ